MLKLCEELVSLVSRSFYPGANIPAGHSKRRSADLVSFARGTRVNWISYKTYTGGRIAQICYQDRVTKKYANLPVLNQVGDNDLLDFLPPAFEAYIDNEVTWEFEKLIAAIVDSKQEGDYLENRSLKCVAVLEFLNSVFQENSSSGYILNPADFENNIGVLEQKVRVSLTQVFPDISEPDMTRICAKLKSLNRRSFQNSIKSLHRVQGLKPDSNQINKFVTIRNSLVHSLSFSSSMSKTEFEQYRTLIGLNDRLVLSLFSYKGVYYDWHKDESVNMNYSNIQTT